MSRGRKQLAALAAPTFIALLCAATPSAAFDSLTQQSPGVMFYFSIPLAAVKTKGEAFSAGLAIQGQRDYETVRIDSRLLNNFIGGGIEAKWIIAGVVGAGAVAVVATKDKSTANAQQQAQAQQAAQQNGGGGGGTCSPKPPTCPH
ncbi:MAG TPA: hypothetical protein VNP36_05325 [Burkholderiales bacterium]|nr:hypothetical protein [Burkholderiales bacterium]